MQEKSPHAGKHQGLLSKKVFVMHTSHSHGNQAGGTPKGLRFREKIALIRAVEAIQAAVEDLEEGRSSKAASDLRCLADSLLDDARAELADLRSIGSLPPIHMINGALSAHRHAILERRAKAEDWSFHWDGDAFEVADSAAGIWLTVDPSDNWTASTSSSPDWLASDSGLLTLITSLNGTTVAEEASRCAAWIKKKGGCE